MVALGAELGPARGRSSRAGRSSRPRSPWAARHELALSVDDVLARRTRLAQELPDRGAAIAPRVAAILGAELGWGEARQRLEVDAYLASARREFSVAPPGRAGPPRNRRLGDPPADRSALRDARTAESQGYGKRWSSAYHPAWKRHGSVRGQTRSSTQTRTPLTADARNPTGSRRLPRGVFVFVYNDKNLTCADCGQEFVFTASEQDFYAQRGFTEPRRCPSCRASRKAARNADGGGSSYGWLRRRRRLLGRRHRQLRRRRRLRLPRSRSPRDVHAPPARPAARRPRSRSARPAASPSTAATASAASAAADPHPLGAGRPTARRTSVILDPVVSRPGSVDSRGGVDPVPRTRVDSVGLTRSRGRSAPQLPLGRLPGEQPEVELALRAVDQAVDVVGVGQPDQRRPDRRVDDVGEWRRRARPAGPAASPGTSPPTRSASPSDT